MPYHIATETQYPNIKAAKNASGILGLNLENCTDHGFTLPTNEPRPDLSDSQTATLASLPTENQDGSWSRKWTTRDKTPEELFNALPFKSLDEAQFALAEWINKLTYQIEGKYPAVIQKGWDDEEAMSLAYMTETETQAQLEILQRLAAKKGRTVDEHVNRVLYLAGTFHAIKTIVHELWLETDAALEAAETPHEYEAIFDAAKAKAAPAAAAYGLSA